MPINKGLLGLVNFARRLEQLAEPGDVYLSGRSPRRLQRNLLGRSEGQKHRGTYTRLPREGMRRSRLGAKATRRKMALRPRGARADRPCGRGILVLSHLIMMVAQMR